MPIDDEESAAIVAALIATLDPSLKEFEIFSVLMDEIAYSGALDLNDVDIIATKILQTKFNPEKDTMH